MASMDINNKNVFNTNPSVSEIQNIESMYNNMSPLAEGIINKKKSTLRALKKKMSIQRDRLDDALKRLGQDPNHHALVESLANDFASLPEVKTIQTAVNVSKAAYKVYSDAQNSTFTKVIEEQTGPLVREIRNIIERLKSIKGKISELENKQKLYETLEKSAITNRKENKEKYRDLEKSHARLTAILGQMLSFRKIFEQIPDSLASEVKIEGFKQNLDVICVEYVSKKVWIHHNIEDYLDDPKMPREFKEIAQVQDSTGTTQNRFGLEDILKDIEKLPRQFINAVANKKDIIGVDTSVTSSSANKTTKTAKKGTEIVDNTQKKDGTLTRDIRSLSLILEQSMAKIRAISGNGQSSVNNVALLSLKNKTLSVLKSQVKSSVTVNVNRTEMLETTKEKMIEKEEKSDKLGFALERLGAKFREGPEVVLSIFKEFGRDLVTRAIMNHGFPKRWEKKGQEVLKDNKREEVRKLYGGDVPFCDEVVIEYNDGKRVFVLKEDAQQLKDGTYVLKSKEDSDAFNTDYGPSDEDIFSSIV